VIGERGRDRRSSSSGGTPKRLSHPPVAGTLFRLRSFDNALRLAPHRTLGRPVSLTFLSRNSLTPKSHATSGGMGLLATAHLTAGVRGDGLLEVDSNDNLLRDRFCGSVANISDGMVTLGDDLGLGIEPDPSSSETYRTA
jgi:hypothetical protein